MCRPNWDEYFMQMIPLVASRSLDPNTKIGAIITDNQNCIVSTGYNSFCRGANDNKPERYERPEKYKWIEHADRNAIYTAARKGISVEGCTMYLPGLPCIDCARGIVQSGIKRVVYDYDKQKAWDSPRYKDDFDTSLQILREGKVYIIAWTKDKTEGNHIHTNRSEAVNGNS